MVSRPGTGSPDVRQPVLCRLWPGSLCLLPTCGTLACLCGALLALALFLSLILAGEGKNDVIFSSTLFSFVILLGFDEKYHWGVSVKSGKYIIFLVAKRSCIIWLSDWHTSPYNLCHIWHQFRSSKLLFMSKDTLTVEYSYCLRVVLLSKNALSD